MMEGICLEEGDDHVGRHIRQHNNCQNGGDCPLGEWPAKGAQRLANLLPWRLLGGAHVAVGDVGRIVNREANGHYDGDHGDCVLQNVRHLL